MYKHYINKLKETNYIINPDKIMKLYIICYIFFSGFVWSEPSISEIVFIIFTPVMLYFGLMIDRKMLLFLLAALTSNVLSIIWPLFRFGLIDIRYIMIDIYLYINVVVFASAIEASFKSKRLYLDEIMKWWILAGIINVLMGFISYITGKKEILGISIVTMGIRLQGLFKDPNVLGPFLIPAAAYLIENILLNKRVKNIQILELGILSIGIFLSFSRAAWLNYFVVAFFLIIYYLKSNLHILFRIFIIAVLASVLLFISYNSHFAIGGYNLTEFFSSRLGLQSYDTDRFSSQAAVIKMFLKSPFWGIGPGNYTTFSLIAAHSLYARAMGEKGIIGFFILMILIIKLIFDKGVYEKNIFIISSFYGILANSIFIDTLHWRHLWVIIALLLYISKDRCIASNDNYSKEIIV